MLMLPPPAELGLRWITEHRDEFSPRRGRDGYEQTMLLKPFAELVLTLTLLGRDHKLRRRLAPVMSWAWAEVEAGNLLLELTSARPELVESVGLYADFADRGFHNPTLATWLAYLSGTTLIEGLELPPWRQVAVEYNLHRLGLHEPAGLPRKSWLAARPEPWTMSAASGYPMTHEVFYLTDFGRRPESLGRDVRRYLTLWLPAWETCFKDPENLDLVAEFVMTAACLGDSLGGHSPGLRLLAERQHQDGTWSGPPGAGHDLPSPPDDAERRRFLSDYHTTLVAVLAFAHEHWTGDKQHSLNNTH